MASDLLNKQDLRTSTPQRWRREQLIAPTMWGCPSPLGPGRCCQRGSTLAEAFPWSVKNLVMVSAMRRQVLPEPVQGCFEPAAQRPAHDASPGPFDDQPQSHLALFVAHEAPQLIAFERFPPLALGFRRAPRQWGGGEGSGEGGVAFFMRLAIVMRATPVSRAMLRCELRPLKRVSTCAHWAALRTAAGTNRPW